MRVKNSAITYTGYEYQTLFGVLKLANWLNNPTEYECICFEADQDGYGGTYTLQIKNLEQEMGKLYKNYSGYISFIIPEEKY